MRIIVSPWAGEVSGADDVPGALGLIKERPASAEIIELAHGPCLLLDRKDGTRIASVFGPLAALEELSRGLPRRTSPF